MNIGTRAESAVAFRDLFRDSHEGLLAFLERLAVNPNTPFLHPTLPHETFLLSSKRLGMVNVLKLGHKDDRLLDWYIYQLNNFCDAISYGTNMVSMQGSWMLENAHKTVQGKSNSLFTSSAGFKGFTVSQMRPHHYFYDQYINAVELSRRTSIQKLGNIFYHDGACYMDSLPGNHRILLNNLKDGCYCFPCTRWGAKSAQHQEEMHEYIRSTARSFEFPKKPVLWIGITGQKRSWLEQVTGYQKIANSIYLKAGALTLLIDGHTSTINMTETNEDDMSIARQIEQGLAEGINVINLIGKGYAKKISLALGINAFIANSGTGCMVPAIFAKKKGVIHSNGVYNAFNIQHSDSIDIINGDPAAPESPGSADHLSYSIEWHRILNPILRILGL